MPNFPPFHLSVNAKGIVSLWDTEKAAQDTSFETYVKLELSLAQVNNLNRAMVLSEQKEYDHASKFNS